MKRIRLIIIVLASVLVIVITVLFVMDIDFQKWKNSISEIPAPENVVIIDSSFYKRNGTPYEGSDDNLSYVFYWIMQISPVESDLERHYFKPVNQINSVFAGWETAVHVIPIEDNTVPSYAGIRDNRILTHLQEVVKDKGSKRMYLVLFIKPGRSFWYN